MSRNARLEPGSNRAVPDVTYAPGLRTKFTPHPRTHTHTRMHCQILFLNKVDLFQDKILNSDRHLRLYFNQYNGEPLGDIIVRDRPLYNIINTVHPVILVQAIFLALLFLLCGA